MNTRRFIIQLGTVAIVTATLLAIGATPTRGDTNLDAIAQLLTDAQNDLLQAVYDFRAVGQPQAHIDIEDALSKINQISAALTDLSVQQALGANLGKFTKLLQKSQQNVVKAEVAADKTSPFGKPTAVIKGISVAARGMYSGSVLLGKPLLAEVVPSAPSRFSSSAGFHRPGETVAFQLDLTGCLEDPTITVQNATGLNQSVDLSSVHLDRTTGMLTLVMGQDEGGASVQVSACGKTVTRLLYNYGGASAQSLPYGFPQGLEVGTYQISVSGTSCVIYYTGESCWTESNDIPAFSVGSFQMVNVKAFAKLLSETGNNILAAFGQDGGALGSSFSSIQDGSFSWTVSETASAGGCECTATATLTIAKL